jgi:hypothetical protein
MIHPRLRAASAAVALLLFFIGIAIAIQPWSGWSSVLPFVLAALFALPAMFGGDVPPAEDLPRIAEQLIRFRSAMVSCFLAALVLLMFAAGRLLPTDDFVQRAASLGAAFWIVAVLLSFFVAYYRTQLRLARRG